MKTDRNIFVAFILNLAFAIFELIGGIITGSIAVASDALHDIGDAISIGISYFLERKSKKQPDEIYTYGYGRFSVLGGAITTLILLLGSMAVICNAVLRILNPAPVHYDGMIVFAMVGVAVNFCAAWFTREGDSINQKAVNLHMLEDVLGWIVVLLGAVVMRFTDLVILDPLMSIGVAVFILMHAIKNLREVLSLFLEKLPRDMDMQKIHGHLMEIDGITDVHHMHIWSMDGNSNYATMHIVTDEDGHHIKEMVREELRHHGIHHATLELEAVGEHCEARDCHIFYCNHSGHHHHHHGHHHHE
jgi:cobalt-zinc-cadmium efflux system protein